MNSKKKFHFILPLLIAVFTLCTLSMSNVEAATQVTKETQKDGMVNENGKWVYYKNGKLDTTYTGMAKNQYGWWYMKNGKLDTTYTGMAKNAYGWWYMNKGKLDTTYTGMAKNQYGWWYMNKGKLDTTYTGMAKNQYGWWYINKGKLDTTYTGVAQNQYGWWYMNKGKLDTTYTGLAKNQNDWWYMNKGKLDTTYTGMVMYKNSWWYIKNGKLDFSYTGLVQNKYGWWYMNKGKLDTTYTGMVQNQNGWWYIKNGKLDFGYTGLAQNKNGWWYMSKGKLDTTYTGIAKNSYGQWYVKRGSVQLKYTGKVILNGTTYYVTGGKITGKPVNKVSLNKTSINLVTNGTNIATLVATVSPSDAVNKTITWSSSNTSVAKVDGNGKVTAVGNGTATITAKTADGGYTASCMVYVTTSVEGVTLNMDTVNLKVGLGIMVLETVSPSTASNQSVIWESSNPNVVTVNEEGYAVAVANGEAVVTVKTVDGGYKASCRITTWTPTESVSLNTPTLNLNTGSEAQLLATVLPGTASNRSVIWSSSNTAVAKVDENGKVTAVGNGTATITVKTADGGYTATCKVTVTTKVTGVSISNTNLSLVTNGTNTATLTSTVTPGNASNKSVTWSSSNTAVATVDANGKVTAVGNGTATITIKTAEGGYTAKCTVTVTTKVTGVSITNKKNVILDCDASSRTYQCAISISPSTASNKSVTWSSTNTSVATVNSSGLITAVGVGTATIGVQSNDSKHYDTINVYVYESKAVAPGGTFRVSIGSTTNRVMDVDKANAYNGAKVQLYSVNSSLGQMWEFHDYSQSNGGYAIVPKCNTQGHILDVNRGNSFSAPLQAGCKVDLWLIGQDNPASMFDLVRFWDGSYAFKLINSNLVVGVTSTAECTQLVAKNFDVNDINQRWFLEKVETSSNIPTGFNEKLQAFKNSYPENYSKGDGNPYTWSDAPFYINGELVGYQCFGFADLIAYNVLGSYPTKLSSGNSLKAGWKITRATASNSYISNIKVGDVVRYANNGWDHSIFITNIVGDTVYYADFNGKGDEKVHYDRTVNKNTLATYLINVLNDGSGYRGWIAHYGN